MRKGFEGLHALASGRLGDEVKSGALFYQQAAHAAQGALLGWDGAVAADQILPVA
jgi:transposase